MGRFHHVLVYMGESPIGRPSVDPSRTEFVYPGYWHFDNGAISKFDDVFIELGGLPHLLPLTVHLKFVVWTSGGDHYQMFLLFEFCCGAWSNLLSAPVPFGFSSYRDLVGVRPRGFWD